MPYVSLKPAEKNQQLASLSCMQSSEEVLSEMGKLSFKELIMALECQKLVENGLKKRDFALAVLMRDFSFDLKRALGSTPSDQNLRLLQTKNGEPLVVYANLSDGEQQLLYRFGTGEKWPLTSHGLFTAAMDPRKRIDPSLQQAFSQTQEFQAVETLFNRAKIAVKREDLISLVLEGSWKTLSDFFEGQNELQDLTDPKRQEFLLNYIGQGSSLAALMMVKLDSQFAIKKLDDERLMQILKLLPEESLETEQFARDLLKTPRSQGVLDLSSRLAKEKKAEDVLKPNTSHRKEALFENSLPKQIVKFTPQTPKVTPKNKEERASVYIVQDGDSLWKIAKKHKVSIDEIRRANCLSSDMLKIGTSLKIPRTS